VKCAGKTLQTVVGCRKLLLIGGRNRAAVRAMQAKLSRCNLIES
jgi:hypothetical protein